MCDAMKMHWGVLTNLLWEIGKVSSKEILGLESTYPRLDVELYASQDLTPPFPSPPLMLLLTFTIWAPFIM